MKVLLVHVYCLTVNSMRFGLFLVGFILLQACSNSNGVISKPDNLIARDTMVMVLKELSLVESYVQTEYVHVSKYQKTMILSGDKILEKYHISRKRLNASMDYYGSHQEEMQAIYTEILDSLNRDVSILSKGVNLKDTSAQLQRVPTGIIPKIER